MIDLLNFLVGVTCAFVLGLASHSVYLHEKARRGWVFPWDHGCRYAGTCSLYQPGGATCSRDGGGAYCGEWRRREA